MELKVILLAVLATLSRAKETKYYFVLSDENIFSACSDAGPGTLDTPAFIDLSELDTTLEEGGLRMSGKSTFVWDIQPQDRVKIDIKLFYFDRGTWTPTLFAYTAHDFCKSMYDSRMPWYTPWTGHVKNVEDVRDKCVYPGTTLIMDNYLMEATIDIPVREGPYKMRITYHAYDSDGNERPTNICINAHGDIQKRND